MIDLRRYLVVIPILASLVLAVYAYYQRTALNAAEDKIRSLEAKAASLAKARPAARWPAPATTTAANPTEIAPSGDSPTAPTAARTGTPPPMRPSAELIGMMEMPEVQQLMDLRSRGQLDSRYAALFKSLRLPPEQLKAFQALLLDKQNTMRDVMTAMRNQGFTPSRESAEQMRTLVQEANAEIDNQIRATLGETAFSQYQNFERTEPQRATVERIQQRLSYTSQPLTEQQSASLVNILVQNTPALSQTTSTALRRSTPGSMGSAPLTEQVMVQARTILAPDQMAALQELQLEQEAQAQLTRRARENFTPARAAAPAGK